MVDRRAQALKQLKLKAVIKESHCSPVQHLDMNLCDADCRNLFATVAKDQVTIYDDSHMGDHVAVVGNLALSSTPEASRDVFHACCWVKSAGLSQHPYGDALLAVGGLDPVIHIISIVGAAVVGQLPLPAGTAVAELSAAAECPGVLLVLCRDGSLQLWQIGSGTCLWSCKTDAFAAAIHPGGSCVLTSSRNGKLSSWDLSGLQVKPGPTGSMPAPSAAAEAVSKEAWLATEHPDSGVDCIRFLTGDLVALKTADGHMSVHSWPSGKLVSSWRVPGSGSSSSTPSYSKRCAFAHTKDGAFVSVGNHQAAAYVYDTRSGRQVTRVEAIRVQGSVKACALSEDCRHLLMVVGHGYLFRFEHRPALLLDAAEPEAEPEAAAAAAEEDATVGEGPSSSSDAEMADAAGADADGAQQQQEEQGDVVQQAAGLLPEAAATPPAQQQQQQQEQCTPSGLGTSPAQLGAGGMEAAGPNSAGSLDALMGVDTTPQAGDSLASGGGQQQQAGTGDSAGGLVGGQHKRQRMTPGDDSPLVFRPTPPHK